MEELGKYLDFKTSWRKLQGWSAILQAAMSIRPQLIACRFRIPNPVLFRSTNVFPSFQTQPFCVSFFSDSCPPKISYDSSEFFYKLFCENNVRHVINRNRRENKFDEFKSGGV
jgi:hypothetical protein